MCISGLNGNKISYDSLFENNQLESIFLYKCVGVMKPYEPMVLRGKRIEYVRKLTESLRV